MGPGSAGGALRGRGGGAAERRVARFSRRGDSAVYSVSSGTAKKQSTNGNQVLQASGSTVSKRMRVSAMLMPSSVSRKYEIIRAKRVFSSVIPR
ncbi:hypothetical protein VT73_01100 [Rathayibacter toxicus]|uniref:Uncharacterized protein n=1 Tax=Rathayibacter toxicus TaxID=145458 RepID=A0A0C5BAK3_9MICO|nr:hypothetical protein TI83_07970 [Rathayibacter toxicus]KKM46903.1 hypothetical protein VT73_01100 [Rathayibacter toxicus]